MKQGGYRGSAPRTAGAAAAMAYKSARAAGIDKARAQEISEHARRRFKAEQREAGREFVRLRRERDALLEALAAALGVSESEALRIARLDMEDDEEPTG